MHSLTLFILTAEVFCHLLIGLVHLRPQVLPERYHHPLTGLLYLAIGLAIAFKH